MLHCLGKTEEPAQDGFRLSLILIYFSKLFHLERSVVSTDLYWALSGGGGDNHGIVVLMTVKTYLEAKVADVGLELLAASTTSENFW